MREGEFEYIHEFKESIDEILWLQRKHHEIIASTTEPTTNKQSSLAEHRLNIPLSNYFVVAPNYWYHYLINNVRKQNNRTKKQTETSSFNSSSIFDLFRNKPFWLWDKQERRQQFIAKDGSCCFNQIIGPPIKDGKEFPLFDYERQLFDSLLKTDKSFK